MKCEAGCPFERWPWVISRQENALCLGENHLTSHFQGHFLYFSVVIVKLYIESLFLFVCFGF